MNTLYEELKQYPQWVSWNDEKVPINPHNGRFASVGDPSSWSKYDMVRDNMRKGFVLTEDDPFTCIDLDHCVGAHGRILSQVTKILLHFQSYTELSPSKTGLHIWVRGCMPAAIKRKEFEIYSRNRYMTVTFNPIFNCSVIDKQKQLDAVWRKYGKDVLFGVPENLESEDCKDDLRALYKQSEYLQALWKLEGEFCKADGSPDWSSYDMALANFLCAWPDNKIVFAIQFFRKEHGAKSKHMGAIAQTIGKVRS